MYNTNTNPELTTFTSRRISAEKRASRCFHVMHHGSKFAWIIRSRREAKEFMDKITEAAAKRGCSILMYSLNSNHSHFVIYGPDWKAVSGTLRSATMSFAAIARKSRMLLAPYDGLPLYSRIETPLDLIKVMTYVADNDNDPAHECFLNGRDEFKFNQFVYIDKDKLEELTHRTAKTIGHLMIADRIEYGEFIRKYMRESEELRVLFVPKGKMVGGEDFSRKFRKKE